MNVSRIKKEELVLQMDELRKNLDNFIDQLEESPPQEEKKMNYKMRVLTGTTPDGEKVYSWVRASSQEELTDKIVQVYVKSGRVWDFVNPNTSAFPQKKEEPSNTTTFREYVEKWLNLYKKTKLKPTTLVGYNTMLNTHFYPAFGDKVFCRITVDDFQRFLNDRSGLSKKYLTDMKKFFGMICRDAVEDGVLEKDLTASRKLSIPSEKKTEREALEKEEFYDIEDHLGDLTPSDRLLLALMMYTGMRRGEVLGLKWGDIDFEKNIISVSRNVTYPTNQPYVGTTKTEAGEREIVIVQNLRDILLRSKIEAEDFIKLANPKVEVEDLYCTGCESPITKMVFVRSWQRINKIIDLHGATPHIFRHTFLTYLVSGGTDIKTVQEMAGHKDIQVTMNRYVHATKMNIQAAGKIFESTVCGTHKDNQKSAESLENAEETNA